MYKFFYHPESDCVLAVPEQEVDSFAETADGGLCHEITLETYLDKVDDPKQIPSDIKGVLKNAEWGKDPYPKETLYGELWYNPKNQFPNGIGIYTSRVTEIRADGIYCTLHAKYFVQFKAGESKEPRR